MHVGIAYPRWRGKRSRYSRCMRIRNFTYPVRGPWSACRIYALFTVFIAHNLGPTLKWVMSASVLVLVRSEFWKLFLHDCSKFGHLYFNESETAMLKGNLRVKRGRMLSDVKITATGCKGNLFESGTVSFLCFRCIAPNPCSLYTKWPHDSITGEIHFKELIPEVYIYNECLRNYYQHMISLS